MNHSYPSSERMKVLQPASSAGLILRRTIWLLAILFSMIFPLSAREKDTTPYGMGLIVNVPYPATEVAQVVQDVVQNGIIRGTKEYNKDEYVSGANAASSTKVFEAWTEGGQVFYKVRLKVIDPRNFKDGGDEGTLAVRYVLQPQGEKNTILKIDARFVEDFRHVSHASNGSVEAAEFKDIRDRLETLDAMKNLAIEARRQRDQKFSSSKSEVATNGGSDSFAPNGAVGPPQSTAAGSTPATEDAPSSANAAAGPPQTLAERVHSLRQQAERLVKAPGAPLKSAPFHTASVLQSLPAGTEVLVVVTTPYWLGVETHEGQHGWISRDQLEQVP